MRIGILKVDSVREEFQHEFGDYPAMFRAVLANALAPGETIEFRDYDVEHGELPARVDECDAYLITGSRESVYNDLPWLEELKRFIVMLDAARHPLIGICFGHQLVAHVLGGETRAAAVGWGVGVKAAAVLEAKPWMQPYVPTVNLLASHKDQVARLPARAQVFAASDYCPYGGFTIDGHIFTLQGHPEFVKDYSRALMNMRRELLGEHVYATGVESLAQPTHEGVVARWILNFIRQAMV